MGLYRKGIELPEDVSGVLHRMEERGFESYVVGGCVRDSLLGRTPKDWDITTSARPDDIQKIFAHNIPYAKNYGIITIPMNENFYEIATFRTDGDYSDGRRPDSISEAASLEEDLARRDFTINAMAYEEGFGIVDCFGGIQDIENGIIRTVGNPDKRFQEDALRMLRAVRFSAQLGFTIDPEAKEAIRRNAHLMCNISSDRFRDEMEKIIMSDNPMALKEADDLGLLDEHFPELSRCLACEQNNPNHLYTVGEHTLHSIEAAPRDKNIRLAMLFHDIGKPACKTTDEKGIDHFYEHPGVSAIKSEFIMKRMHYDNKTIDKVCRLVKYHDKAFSKKPVKFKQLLNEIGKENFEDLMTVKRCDIAAQSDYMREDKLLKVNEWEKKYTEIIEKREPVSIKDLAINGNDLIRLGMEPGPEIKRVQIEMLNEVRNCPEHNTKEWLEGMGRRKVQQMERQERKRGEER